MEILLKKKTKKTKTKTKKQRNKENKQDGRQTSRFYLRDLVGRRRTGSSLRRGDPFGFC